MKTLTLTQGYEAVVDDDWFYAIGHLNWFVHRRRNSAIYARRNLLLHGERMIIYLHRFIVGIPSPVTVEYKNGNHMDLQQDNLLLYYKEKELDWGTDLDVDGGAVRCQFDEIALNMLTGLWAARLNRLLIGYFKTVYEAVKARNEAIMTMKNRSLRIYELPMEGWNGETSQS